jgi:quercetin dioxygenase-like cupin family protein
VRLILASIALTVLGLASTGRAQDPLKILPDSYRLELENEWVRVVQVRYAAKAKLAGHDHPTGPTAFVYLSDSGPILFKHVGLSYGVIGRPATVAGAIRLARAVQEVHEVENPGDTASEFLRVEFKRMPLDTPLRGRFYPESHPPGENVATMHFENDHLRLTRHACAPELACDLSAAVPALVVALTAGRVQVGESEPQALPRGRSHWLAPGEKRVMRNKETSPAEFLVFEFKGGGR